MSDEARPVLIALAVAGSPTPPVPSTQWMCLDCAGEVWVSHQMDPLVRDGEADPVCERCARRRVLRGEEFELGEVPPKQAGQLAAYGIDPVKVGASYMRYLHRPKGQPWSG